MMLFVYSGNGNSIPSVDTVRGSLPVEGRSPGSGCVLGVVRAHHGNHPGQRVHHGRARAADAGVRRSAGPASHRVSVSGSATRPTSFTPDARITANTCTTSA